MQKLNTPKTDLTASVLVLGTDLFGSTVSRKMSMQLMDLYIDAGGNMIDTAQSLLCGLRDPERNIVVRLTAESRLGRSRYFDADYAIAIVSYFRVANVPDAPI